MSLFSLHTHIYWTRTAKRQKEVERTYGGLLPAVEGHSLGTRYRYEVHICVCVCVCVCGGRNLTERKSVNASNTGFHVILYYVNLILIHIHHEVFRFYYNSDLPTLI